MNILKIRTDSHTDYRSLGIHHCSDLPAETIQCDISDDDINKNNNAFSPNLVCKCICEKIDLTYWESKHNATHFILRLKHDIYRLSV